MTGLDEPNFELFTSFQIDFPNDERITAATPIQIIGFLFFCTDEAHTCHMKKEKVVAFCT